MVKHTQRIRLQQPTNCFSVFDHFVELERYIINVNVEQVNIKPYRNW